MKKSLSTLLLSITVVCCFAQTPLMFNYQTVLRDLTRQVLVNRKINFRFSILQSNPGGPAVFIETQTATTNQFGLVNLAIGAGKRTKGNLAEINWSEGVFFLQIEVEEEGGADFQIMGTTQLLSMPFAIYAATARSSDDWKNLGDSVLYSTKKIGIGVSNPQAAFQVNGDIRGKRIIVEGLDRAHLVNTTDGEQLPAGTVVVFDEIQPGKIRPCTTAYDRKIPGVISNLNLEKKYYAAIVQEQENTRSGSPVALDGIVEVLAVGPIATGDFLTTSAVAGHAMRAKNRRKSHGAVIGRAITPLAKGEKGMVDILVSQP